MEIIESIAWITLGFFPMLGSMELAWRLHKRYAVSKSMAKEASSFINVGPPSAKSLSLSPLPISAIRGYMGL
jgi:hypothetical protein